MVDITRAGGGSGRGGSAGRSGQVGAQAGCDDRRAGRGAHGGWCTCADARLMATEVEDEEVRATPREGLGAGLVITYWCARSEQDWCPESRETMIMMFITKAGQGRRGE